jgi:hypothetical protein
MGPDEPVGSSRSHHRNRNLIIVGGLALVLVAGVVFVGVNPTGDRAGTAVTDASPSPSPTATTAAPSTSAPSPNVAWVTPVPPEPLLGTPAITPTPSPTATTASPSSSATVVTTTCAAGGACVVGDIGPGGGLVFVISGGLHYEMAPKTWSGAPDVLQKWCNNTTTALPGTFGTAVGTGAQNTVLMDAGCASGAGQSAADYAGGGKSDWFLPSKDELNEMYLYSKVVGFNAATYGFAGANYWSSSQSSTYYVATTAISQSFFYGTQYDAGKDYTPRVRPVRSF